MKIKIKIHREIEIPDGFFCIGKSRCSGLTESFEYGSSRACSNFNGMVFPSNGTGRYVKCAQCIDATVKFLESSESAT